MFFSCGGIGTCLRTSIQHEVLYPSTGIGNLYGKLSAHIQTQIPAGFLQDTRTITMTVRPDFSSIDSLFPRSTLCSE